MSSSILKVVSKSEVINTAEAEIYYDILRSQSLEQLFEASLILKKMTIKEFETLEIIFRRKDKTVSYPIWHLINGYISDAIYHTGLIVSYRRSSGNPIHSGTNIFMGKTKNL